MQDDILDDGLVFPKAATVENAKEIIRLKLDYAELHKKVKHGRTAIWWMVAIFALGAFVETFQYDFEPIFMAVNFTIVGAMAATGILSRKKPFLGLMLGAIVIILVQSLIFIGGDIVNSIRGIIPRLIILYFIIVGMNAAKKYMETLQGLKAHGITADGVELV